MIENPLLTQIRSAIAKAEGNDQEGRRP
jgi:hypothetical protein